MNILVVLMPRIDLEVLIFTKYELKLLNLKISLNVYRLNLTTPQPYNGNNSSMDSKTIHLSAYIKRPSVSRFIC